MTEQAEDGIMKLSVEMFFYVCATALLALSVSCSDDGGSGSPDAETDLGDTQVSETSDTDDNDVTETEDDVSDTESDLEDAVADTTDTETVETDTNVEDTQEVEEEVTPPEPLKVEETTPAADSTVAPPVRSVIVRFDQSVRVDPTDDVPIVLQVRKLPDGQPEDLTFDRLRIGGPGSNTFDFKAIDIERFSGSFSSGSTWEISLSGFATASERVLMEPYTFEFTVENPCGDGICSAGESKCNCSADCGQCSGCCQFQGGNNSTCLPGTADNACGQSGQSCGVCLSPDECINGQGCG